MKALCWHAKNDIRCDEVPDPKIEHPRDAIVKVTSCAICGSDLHLYDGFMPGMEFGDIMGHDLQRDPVHTMPLAITIRFRHEWPAAYGDGNEAPRFHHTAR
jgi:Alcohol dehydrogenase GroES-like domain